MLSGTKVQADAEITLTADTPWVVPPNQPEAVQRALADIERDWYKVLGHRPILWTEQPESWSGPVLRFGISGKPGAPETFSLQIENNTLSATGVDIRGAIYAAYAVSEEILGVDPWYFWTDHEPSPRKQIEVPAGLKKNFGPPTFRYRGWFINDEDLLNGFSPDPLRRNPYSLEMLDRICETILRLRGNMIVPGTFNFPDESCWELASRRGLVLNMHHTAFGHTLEKEFADPPVDSRPRAFWCWLNGRMSKEHIKAGDKPLKSGLLGPVRILSE